MVSNQTMRFHADAKTHGTICRHCSTKPCRSYLQRNVWKFGLAGLLKLLQYSSVRRLWIVDLCIVRLLLIRVEICRRILRSSEVNRSVQNSQREVCGYCSPAGPVRLHSLLTVCVCSLLRLLVGQYVRKFVTVCMQLLQVVGCQ